MTVLSVEGLCKSYPSFSLDEVTFHLPEGQITGFIGRNGAGKTTTLKALVNLVHPDKGKISFFDMPFGSHEWEIKEKIGFVSGGIDYYPNKKLRTITSATRCFYENWDDRAYRNYLNRFNLDENKTPRQLSDGMRVKYALTLALSHHAGLLMLDEPTSGLDPVSREDLMDEFKALSGEGVTILFSTHITSDLDKCADHVVYIKEGRILADKSLRDFVASYSDPGKSATLEDIMIHLERSVAV